MQRLLVFSSVLIVVASSDRVEACSCLPVDLALQVERSDVAFEGVVLPGPCVEQIKRPPIRWPQSSEGACIAGVVGDEQDCPVVGATVELRLGQSLVRRVKTKEDGTYEACGLVPGDYEATFRGPHLDDEAWMARKAVEAHDGEMNVSSVLRSHPLETTATVRVEKALKGTVEGEELVVTTALLGASCGLGYLNPGDVWRLTAKRRGGKLHVGACSSERIGHVPPGALKSGGCAGCQTAPVENIPWFLIPTVAALVVWRRRKLTW